MKVEAVGAEYKEITVNVNNEVVVFKDNITEVSDELGQLMVDEFPYFFPEGKVVVEKEEKVPHVFDETKYQQQEDQIIQLRNSLKTKSQQIAELKAEIADWKRMYEESQERFIAMAPSTNGAKEVEKETETVAAPVNEVESVEDVEKKLMSQTLGELKNLAKKLSVPSEIVKRKIEKKSWVKAIIEYTYK